jgi:hypothetical protein
VKRAAALVAVAVCHAACSRPLPEAGTPSADLYAARCSGCHRAYAPSSLTLATWLMVLPRMEQRLAAAGQALTADEQRLIVDYLRRNAAGADPSLATPPRR